jgi:hypothetical protein
MIRRFWLKLLRRRGLEQDLEAELALHREMAREAGNPIPFGNRALIEEQARDLWCFSSLENLWRDVRYGARGLIRDPVLLLAALASLGLGIGANTTLFSLATELLLSEPSVRDARSLVHVRLGGNSHSRPEAVEFLRRSGVFEEVAGQREDAFVNWIDGAETRRLHCIYTTKNFFTALGTPMAFGRGYGDHDPNEVVVLHHHFWRRHFQGDTSIIGRVINLEGKPYTVVGILPESHRTLVGFGYSPDVYLPGFTYAFSIYSRLKPDQTREAALHAVQAVGTRLDRELAEPSFKYANHCQVSAIAGFDRIHQEAVLTVGAFFLVLLVIAGLVLLIACINVASLLLARARRAAARSAYAWRWEPGARACCSNCWSRASCWRSWRRHSDWRWRTC